VAASARGVRLREFIPGAADQARQRSTSSFGAAHLISRLRTVLRLGKQVRLCPMSAPQPPQPVRYHPSVAPSTTQRIDAPKAWPLNAGCHMLLMYCCVRARQVTVGWDDGLRAEGAAAQAAALQRLAAALDRLEGLDLAGVHVMLGARSGIDNLGQAWLHSAGFTDEWVR